MPRRSLSKNDWSVAFIVFEDGEQSTFRYSGTEAFDMEAFSSWVRSRFGVESNVGLKYICDNHEILPSLSMLQLGIPIKISAIPKDKKVPSPKAAAAPSSTTFLHFNGYFALLSLLIAFSFSPHTTGTPSSLVAIMIDKLVSILQLSNTWRKLLIEAYIASLCWGSTYLFIRRMWNPENAPTSQAIQKFAADAIFGGIAAGGSVIMKHFLVNLIK